MATSIYQAFEKLRQNLEITPLQSEIVSTRQNQVRNAMAAGLNVKDSFLTGSYIRNTLIGPLAEADIDIFILLDPQYYHHYNNGQHGGQAGLLDRVKHVLKRNYPKTPDISRNGQAVTISFADFKTDVVPAFERPGGGYIIPNSKQSIWIETNPKIHTQLMASENAAHDKRLVPLVKMIKGWNRQISNAFVPFYLELLATNILRGMKISNYSSGIRYFFDKGREKIKYKVKDPVEYGGHINGFTNIKTVSEAVNCFETAYQRAIKAENYDIRGHIQYAIEEWRKLLGDYFPAYG